MLRKLLIAGMTLLLLSAQPSVAPASATGFLDDFVPPPTGPILIDIVTIDGSGCPDGTADVAFASDNSGFAVTYSEFLAQVGVGTSPVDFRKHCQLSLAVHVPRGYTYAISQMDVRGFASLATGATAIHRANHHFQGQPQPDYRSHSFTGPVVDNWQFTDEINLAELVFHPCGELRNLNINTELRVDAGTSDPTTTTSFITMDPTRGAFSNYRLRWRNCS